MQCFLKFVICPLIITHITIGKSNNDTTGKYIQFNSVHNELLNADLPAWYGALKESTFIALGGDLNNLRKHLQNAQFYGYVKSNRSFGDIVVESKGKFRKIGEEIYGFHQTNDYEEESLLNFQNIKALFLVEKIRHHMKQNAGYRYDLRFTIIPVDEILKKKERSLHDLRKRVFILRDIDYPEYFSSSSSSPHRVQQLRMRSDNFPISQRPMFFNRVSPLNFGEYQKFSKPSHRHMVHHQNSNRFPIRFPDSLEAMSSVKHVRSKKPYEIYQLDHRGAAPESNKLHEELNLRSSFYQPASITIPMIAVPQMSILHIPYAFPMQFQTPNIENQRSQSTFSKNLAQIKSIAHVENLGVNSIRVQKFSLPDRKENKNDSIFNKHENKVPIKYSPKLSEYMDQNGFKPIIPPYHYMSTPTLANEILSTAATFITTEKSKSQKKNDWKIPKRIQTSTTESTSTEMTERPILKSYPKKTRNKILSSLTTQSTIVETTPIIRNNSSTRSLPFRGRNRFLLREKNFRNLTTATEKSTISSKWKAITSTILPNVETTKLIPNYATTTRENESTTLKPQNIIELISANVEEVKKNNSSSNINIYKVTEIDDLDSTVEPASNF